MSTTTTTTTTTTRDRGDRYGPMEWVQLPERAHDEGVEDHLARVQQVADGDLSVEQRWHGGRLTARAEQSTQRTSKTTQH